MHERVIVVILFVCQSVCHALILGQLTIDLGMNLLRTKRQDLSLCYVFLAYSCENAKLSAPCRYQLLWVTPPSITF